MVPLVEEEELLANLTRRDYVEVEARDIRDFAAYVIEAVVLPCITVFGILGETFVYFYQCVHLCGEKKSSKAIINRTWTDAY